MAKGTKDKFAELDGEFKESVESMTDQEILDRVANISLENAQVQAKKKLDLDLKEKAATFAEAGAVYKESAKGAKLRIDYALSILEGRGKK